MTRKDAIEKMREWEIHDRQEGQQHSSLYLYGLYNGRADAFKEAIKLLTEATND